MTDKITVPRETWDAMREALEEYLNKDNVELQLNGIKSKAIEAITAANAVSAEPLKVTDLGHHALEPQAQREIEEWLDANRMQKIGSLHHELVARFVAHPQATEPAGKTRDPLDLGQYVNEANISANDKPVAVIEKLQAVINVKKGFQ